MAWGNWCYCGRGGRGAVSSVLPAAAAAAAVFLLVAALADVADGVAHERPAINTAAASAARSSAPAPRRMASARPAPAPMTNRMRMSHKPAPQMTHRTKHVKTAPVHHAPRPMPTYEKDYDDHKYEWYKPQKHGYKHDKAYGHDDKYSEKSYGGDYEEDYYQEPSYGHTSSYGGSYDHDDGYGSYKGSYDHYEPSSYAGTQSHRYRRSVDSYKPRYRRSVDWYKPQPQKYGYSHDVSYGPDKYSEKSYGHDNKYSAKSYGHEGYGSYKGSYDHYEPSSYAESYGHEVKYSDKSYGHDDKYSEKSYGHKYSDKSYGSDYEVEADYHEPSYEQTSSYGESYGHDDKYSDKSYGSDYKEEADYHKPSYEQASSYGESYNVEPSYEHEDDSYGSYGYKHEDDGYGSYEESYDRHEPSYAASYRHRRSVNSSVEDEGGVREAQSKFGCCDRLKIANDGESEDSGPALLVPFLYQVTFEIRSGSVGGKDHWVSDNGEYAIWYREGGWFVGTIMSLGSLKGHAHNTASSDCPHDFDYGWDYFADCINEWAEAKNGFNVNCKA